MKIKTDEFNNKTYQFKQKVNEDNQVYLLIERGYNDKLLITIHNGNYDEQHIEVKGIDFPDTSDKTIEYRIDINEETINI